MSDAIDAVVDAVVSTVQDVRSGLAGRYIRESDETQPREEREAILEADELLERRLLGLDAVASYASEKREEIHEAETGGDYHVAANPLDGSSKLESNDTMGTIFGIYEESLPASGRDLVASGLALYGPITTLVVARDEGVSEAVIEADGTRRIVDRELTIPADPTVYGFGGRVSRWTDDFADYVAEVERELKLRYGGAVVGDVNQVLAYGGIFGYPGLRDRPEGTFRLLFESHPIAHVVESAGGASSNGERSLLACEPDRLHERTPLFVGNDEYVGRLEAALG